MSDNLSRAFAVDLEVRADSTGRTVHGIVVPFDSPTRVSDGGMPYMEAFQMGAFAKTIRERGERVKLLSQHNSRTNPLGRASMLREDASGLYGEFRVSKTAAGDDALELLRDGALDSFSVGFTPIKHEKRQRVTWRTEVALREASLVTFPAYEGALIGGVRSMDLSPDELDELKRILAEHMNSADTPPVEPSAATGDLPEHPDGEPGPVPTQSASNHRRLRAKARREGGPLS